MEIANHWCAVYHRLTFETEHQTENAMRARVLWPHVQQHLLRLHPFGSVRVLRIYIYFLVCSHKHLSSSHCFNVALSEPLDLVRRRGCISFADAIEPYRRIRKPKLNDQISPISTAIPAN